MMGMYNICDVWSVRCEMSGDEALSIGNIPVRPATFGMPWNRLLMAFLLLFMAFLQMNVITVTL